MTDARKERTSNIVAVTTMIVQGGGGFLFIAWLFARADQMVPMLKTVMPVLAIIAASAAAVDIIELAMQH